MEPRRFKTALIAIFLAPFFGSLPSFAATGTEPRPFQCVISALRRIVSPQLDSAVELELPVTDRVRKIFTTTNGRLGPLFQDGVKPPAWLETVRRSTAASSVEDIRWDALHPRDQLALLHDLGKQRDPLVYQTNRKIPGLTIRDSVLVGDEKLNLSSVLMPYVEYGNKEAVANLNRVEIHYRAREGAGTASRNASLLLRRIKVDPPHQHVHMVAKLPPVSTAAEARLEAARKANLVARANLLAEMEAVLDRKVPVQLVGENDDLSFAYLSGRFLGAVAESFESQLTSGEVQMGDHFKGFFVGVRGSDKYDASGLWGLEYRAVPKPRSATDARTAEILDGIHATMVDPHHGLEPDRIQKWLDQEVKNLPLPLVMEKTWYNQKIKDLFATAPKEIREAMDDGFRDKVTQLARKNQLVKALLHDWSRDPLFFDNPQAQARIFAAQWKALYRLALNPDPGIADRELTIFFRGSGIYERVARSLHVGAEFKK